MFSRRLLAPLLRTHLCALPPLHRRYGASPILHLFKSSTEANPLPPPPPPPPNEQQQPKVYDFAAIRELSAHPSRDRLLIDVREPSEYRAGSIPGSINLPIASAPDALLLADEEFEDRFGFAKPQRDQELVFYCKAGIRSSAAANVARAEGYEKVGEYRGSWLDWEKNMKGAQ